MSMNPRPSTMSSPSNQESALNAEANGQDKTSDTDLTFTYPTLTSGSSSKETSTPETDPSSSKSKKPIQNLISAWSSSPTTKSTKTPILVTPIGPPSTDTAITWVGTSPKDGSPLLKALDVVHGDRGIDYGHPSVDFARTAKMWSAIFGIDIPIWKVPLAMIAVKISREVNQQKEDNLVDIAGYVETLRMTYQKEERE